jgi:hypothetical protein
MRGGWRDTDGAFPLLSHRILHRVRTKCHIATHSGGRGVFAIGGANHVIGLVTGIFVFLVIRMTRSILGIKYTYRSSSRPDCGVIATELLWTKHSDSKYLLKAPLRWLWRWNQGHNRFYGSHRNATITSVSGFSGFDLHCHGQLL